MNIKMHLPGHLVLKLFVKKLFNILKSSKSTPQWKVKILHTPCVINSPSYYDVIVENLRCSHHF